MRHLFPKAAALAFCIAAAPVSATDDGQFFVNGSLGQSNYHLPDATRARFSTVDRQDSAAALRVGYRWNSVVDYGVEFGYAHFGNVKGRFDNAAGSLRERDKMHGWTAGGKLHYDITPRWYASARAGWIRAHTKFKTTATGSGVSMSRTLPRTGEYFGAGVGYNIDEHISVGLGYDNYHVRFGARGRGDDWNVGMYSLTGEYRF